MYKKELIPLGRAKDITGQRFGRLLAVGRTHNIGKHTAWLCKCDCGNKTIVNTTHLVSGDTRSCGCLHKEVTSKDLTGQRFGRLIAVRPTGNRNGTNVIWECLCDCGSITYVGSGNLSSGRTKSCGCLNVGENHYNYNPSKTDEERLKKRYILGKHRISNFRNAVYQRDEYTCQLCGQVSGKLNAHHLDSWDWAKDLRFEIGNGVTLCEHCHSNFHDVYGYGNNTKEQYEAFKNKMTHTQA